MRSIREQPASSIRPRQTLGNQTTISVVLDQPIMFFAVTAYTADGLESSPSEELLVRGNPPSAYHPRPRPGSPQFPALIS